MDYRRIDDVCSRIIALAVDHQIIVFTHNICLVRRRVTCQGGQEKLKYYDIRLEAAMPA
jgi:hypothetical protein